jgi:hypothetical protein
VTNLTKIAVGTKTIRRTATVMIIKIAFRVLFIDYIVLRIIILSIIQQYKNPAITDEVFIFGCERGMMFEI